MPQKYMRRQRDYALLEMRYAKFLKIAALPEDQWDAALLALLHEFDRENSQRDANTGSVVSDGTEELPTWQTQLAFPKRSWEELKQLIVTFLKLLIDDELGKPNQFLVLDSVLGTESDSEPVIRDT